MSGMTRTITILAAILLFLAHTPVAVAGCDAYDAYIEGAFTSSEYYSGAIARCYWQGLYSSAFISIDHSISSDRYSWGPVYWNSVHAVSHEVSDSTNWFGSSGECLTSNATFFIAEPTTYNPVYLDVPASYMCCLPGNTTINEGNECPPGGCPDTPIVLDLSGTGYWFTSAGEGVEFDIRDSGVPVQTAWTSPLVENAFLCLDRNGDGEITSGAELFGNATPLRSGATAKNGFTALAEFDENGDGLIDSRDSIWQELLLWVDRNHDGRSSSDEIIPAYEVILGLGVDYRTIGRRDRFGNLLRYASVFWIGGPNNSVISRAYHDVLLVSMP
jgi:hypothetical protein